jgi:hypothetical protein
MRHAAKRAAIALVIVGSVACLSAGCLNENYFKMRALSAIEREWSPTAPRCSLEIAGNALGAGTIVFCPSPSTGESATPTWLYSWGVSYTITDSARSLTPKLGALAAADDEAFHLAGLDRRRFQQQIAGMIRAQPKQKASR